MQEGSFYCFVPRQAAALPWLTFGKSPDRQVQERFDDLLTRGALTRARRNKPTSTLDSSSSDQLHILPGGGIQVQHGIRKVAGELQRTQPHVYSTKSAVIVFTGYLSNLTELLDRCQLQDSIPESRSPIFRSNATSFDINGDVDQGTLAAQIVLHMYLRARADQSFMLLLAELQGHYSFVVYDSSKRQVFAARDPSGEPQCTLYYNLEDDGDISLTNKPFEVEGSVVYAAWTEMPPGHFLSGKQANLQQFALTPAQLYTREVHQSMDDDRPGSLESSGELTPRNSRRSQMPYSTGAGQDSNLSLGPANRYAPSTDCTTSSSSVRASSSSTGTMYWQHHRQLEESQRSSTKSASTLGPASFGQANGAASGSIPHTTSAQQLASLTSFLQPACPQPAVHKYASGSSAGWDHVIDMQLALQSGGLQPVPLPHLSQADHAPGCSQPAARLQDAGYAIFNLELQRQYSQDCDPPGWIKQQQFRSTTTCISNTSAFVEGHVSAQTMSSQHGRPLQRTAVLSKPAPDQAHRHSLQGTSATSWKRPYSKQPKHESQPGVLPKDNGTHPLAAGVEPSLEADCSIPVSANGPHSLVEYFKPDELLPCFKNRTGQQPSSMSEQTLAASTFPGTSSELYRPAQLDLQQQQPPPSQTGHQPSRVTAPLPQIMSRINESPVHAAAPQHFVTAEYPLRPGLLDLPTVERVRCPRTNIRRRVHGKKVVRCLQERLDAAAAQSACTPAAFNADGRLQQSFTNPTWSPEPASALPSPCSSNRAQATTHPVAPQSIWETLQGPWDPSPSWWFSPLESHLEQGPGSHQLRGIPSGITEAESIEPHSLPRHGLHPALSDIVLSERPVSSGRTVSQGHFTTDQNSRLLPADAAQEETQQVTNTAYSASRRSPESHPSVAPFEPQLDASAKSIGSAHVPYDPFHIRSIDPQAVRSTFQAASTAIKPEVPPARDTVASSCMSSSSSSYRSARSSSHLSTVLGAVCFSARRQASHHRPIATSTWSGERAPALAPPEESISPEALKTRRSLSPIGSRRRHQAGSDSMEGPAGHPDRPVRAEGADKTQQARFQHDSLDISDGQASQQSSSDPSQASAWTSFSLQLSHQHPSTSADVEWQQQLHVNGSCSDMWSLGAVLLSLLRGSALPFDPPGLGSARLHAGMLPDALQTWLDGKLERLGLQDHAGASKNAANLVRSLLHADPAQRLSAAQARKSSWLMSRPLPLEYPKNKAREAVAAEETESLSSWNTVDGATEALGHLWLQPEAAAGSPSCSAASGNEVAGGYPSFMRADPEDLAQEHSAAMLDGRREPRVSAWLHKLLRKKNHLHKSHT
ncbi:hypothetical protein WJX74_006104 [Apatococcus lobatus]|uniref:Glutamine amidotransferase type-2 domain-containing protein n=1 Tax=Apatococcus lobatus TaxID=904363 RepID=A0AAW1RSK5_9CHLO